jgi:hypothetical protein
MGADELLTSLNAAIEFRNQGQLVRSLAILNNAGVPPEGASQAQSWKTHQNYLRGVIFADTGKYPQAAHYLLCAYQENPKRFDVCELLGKCYSEMGDLLQAGFFLKKSFELQSWFGREDTIVIGDSHSKFLFAGVPRCRVNWIGPVTMYRVGRDGLAALDFAAHGVNGKNVILSFGEIDVRVHVHKRGELHSGKAEGVISDLVSAFYSSIQLNRVLFPTVRVAVVSVVPPLNLAENPLFPKSGTLEQRAAYTNLLNEQLRTRAVSEGCYFMDVYRYFSDPSGAMCPRLSDGNCHALPRYFDLLEYEIMKAFGV